MTDLVIEVEICARSHNVCGIATCIRAFHECPQWVITYSHKSNNKRVLIFYGMTVYRRISATIIRRKQRDCRVNTLLVYLTTVRVANSILMSFNEIIYSLVKLFILQFFYLLYVVITLRKIFIYYKPWIAQFGRAQSK